MDVLLNLLRGIQPIALEVAVVVVGLVLFFCESFWPQADKKSLCTGAISALLLVFVLSLFAQGTPSSFDRFYSANELSMFFKRFALLATVLMLVVAYEFQPILERYLPSAKPGAGRDTLWRA